MSERPETTLLNSKPDESSYGVFLTLSPSLLKTIEEQVIKQNCKNKQELILDAIKFYLKTYCESKVQITFTET